MGQLHEREPGLRERLRAATASAHARLDARMAEGFPDDGAYRAYLQGMHAFIASLLSAVRGQAQRMEWALPPWEPALAADMAVLDVAPLAAEPVDEPDRHGALGALYVMEGAGLGARILVRRALALGHDRERGARFLSLHADGEGGRRWPRFLAMLDRTGTDAFPDACAAALAAFALAQRCFERADGARLGRQPRAA